MSIVFVVDSTADLKPEIAGRVRVVPMTIRFGEEEYTDGVDISAARFYDMLPTAQALPATSQPSPAAFEDVFSQITEEGHEVFCITISSRLSGTYQSATIAAREFPGKVFVLDSRSVAIGTAILAEYAIGLADAGMKAQALLEEMMAVREKLRLYALVDTLEYLKRGGRLSSAGAFVGGLLNIKPLIIVEDGQLRVMGKARGVRAGYNLLAQAIEADGLDRYMPAMLGYTGNDPSVAEKYAAENGGLYPEDTAISIVGATVGTHTGPGVLAVAYFRK